MHTFHGHQSRIRSMAIDTRDGALITGSIEGDMKASLQRFKPLHVASPYH